MGQLKRESSKAGPGNLATAASCGELLGTASPAARCLANHFSRHLDGDRGISQGRATNCHVWISGGLRTTSKAVATCADHGVLSSKRTLLTHSLKILLTTKKSMLRPL